MAFHNVPPNGFPDLPDMEEMEAVVKDVSGVKTSVAGLTEDVSDLNDNKANQITIAPFFSAETAYEVGDLVYYNGLSYQCTNDHEGEWDADDFAPTTIAGELATVKSGLTDLDVSIYGPENKSNLDFNTLTEKYSCRIGNLATCTNTPNSASTGVSGVLIIEPHGTTIIQKFYGDLGESHRLSFDTGTTWKSWV